MQRNRVDWTQALFAALALAASVIAIYLIVRFGPQTRVLVVVGIAITIATLSSGLARWASSETRLTLLIVAGSTMIAVYLAELHIDRLLPAPLSRLVVTASNQGSTDNRLGIDVLRDIRESGDLTAVPSFWPNDSIAQGGLEAEGERIQPLSGIAGRTTITCNESGYWPTYTSDAFGFRNPPEAWINPVELGAVGDSFGQGLCVHTEDSMLAHIRATYPRTVNVSFGGNGPLIELAAMKEYLAPLHPKRILWFYYEGNDLENLESERLSPVLTSYLSGGAVQNLRSRQAQVDGALERRLNEQMKNPRNVTLTDILLLRGLRTTLGLEIEPTKPVLLHSPVPSLAPFEAVMIAAQASVRSWDGEIVFVYLPEFNRFGSSDDVSPHRDAVLEIVRKTGITVVDLVPIFARHQDPASLFAQRRINHYTPEGYKIAADAILAELTLPHHGLVAGRSASRK